MLLIVVGQITDIVIGKSIPFLQQKPLTKWNIKCPCGH